MTTGSLFDAMQRRMVHDMAYSWSLGKKARTIRDRLFRDATQAMSEDLDADRLSPAQQHIRKTVEDTESDLRALFAAFGRELQTENMEADPASLAAVALVADLMGRIVGLELRVAALEAALD